MSCIEQLGGRPWTVGSLLVKDGQQDVTDFSLHYRLLTPTNNKRNPWFLPFWKQVLNTFVMEHK